MSEEHAERRRQDKIKTDQEKQDVVEVMNTASGRRLVYKLLSRAGIYRCSFNGQSNGTIFAEGGRNQGLMLLADVQTFAPGSYLIMLKENGNG